MSPYPLTPYRNLRTTSLEADALTLPAGACILAGVPWRMHIHMHALPRST